MIRVIKKALTHDRVIHLGSRIETRNPGANI